ncbi:hypothetical protein BGX26_001350 [Mortierella sp. AD094]|nr:hypothetical protein BGX26_001350 [Mortierella sp. AD094]
MSPVPPRSTALQTSQPSQPPQLKSISANSTPKFVALSNPNNSPMKTPSNIRGNGARRAMSDNPTQISSSTSTLNNLTVDTLRSPTCGSQNSNSLVSPNQLQGIVVESMKTPTHGPGEASFDYDKGKGNVGFGGGMFQPEDSSEQRGIPWMLYRQRSHSAGAAVPQTQSPAALSTRTMSSTTSDGKRSNRTTLARSTSSNYSGSPLIKPNNSSEYLSKIAKIAPKGDDDDSVILPSSLKAASYNNGDDSDQSNSCTDNDETDNRSSGPSGSMRAHHKQYGSVRRSCSGRTGGKSQYSAYRRNAQDIDDVQQQNEGHGCDDAMAAPSRYGSRTCGVEFSSASLYVSTDNLNTATMTTQAMDGNQFQHLFNFQARQIQRVREMHIGSMMAASNPSSVQHPNAVQSPALSPMSPHSVNSVSTAGSQLSTPSTIMTDSSFLSQSSYSSGDTSSYVCDYTSSSPSSTDTSTSTYVAESGGYPNEKGDFHHEELQQQQTPTPTSRQQPQHPNGFIQYIHKSFLPVTSQFTTHTFSNQKSRKTNTAKTHKGSKHNLSSKSSEPQLTSSLYFISGLHDLKKTKKRGAGSGGRWNKNTNAYAYTGPDSKAFFSNERTFLHRIKFGLLLGSMALTLLSFGTSTDITSETSVGVYVGLFLVLVTMVTLVYATAVFHLRYRWMIELRTDVEFYDRTGPTLLFVALFLAYATNVALTMKKFVGDYADDRGLNFYTDEPLDA